MIINSNYLDIIRDTVTYPESADPELVRQAAAEHAEECRRANQRLRQIDKLLRDGLRSEAIQQAELEPQLLTLVADLDLPFLEEWEGMLAQWGFPLPPKLDLEIAQRLNGAYAELRPLEQLLRQHRLLALARAPLYTRIEVLRKIAKLDELNFAWESDLADYERTRLRQILAESKEAVQRRDLQAVEALRKELSYQYWSCEVPVDLRNEIDTGYQTLAHDNARSRLVSLAPQLVKAHSELDVNRAEELANEWTRFAKVARLEANEHLAFQVRETMTWLEAALKDREIQARYATLLETLEGSLEQDASQKLLESLLHKIERYNLPIPERLADRVRNRIEAHEAHAHRRGMLLGVATVSALLIICVALFSFWRIKHREGQLADHRAALQTIVDAGHWNEAEKYFGGLDEFERTDPHIASLFEQAAQALKSEAARAESVDKLLRDAESLSAAELDRNRLTHIKKMVKTSDEQVRLDELELKLNQYEQAQQEERDNAYLAVIKAWSEKLATLERHGNPDSQNLWSMLSQLEDDLARHTRISYGLEQRGKILVNKLSAIIKQEADAEDERRLMKAAFQAVGQPDAYSARLAEIVTKHPNSQSASHARQVLDDQQAWTSVLAWATFWAPYPTDRPFALSDANEIIVRGNTLKTKTLINELSIRFDERIPYLQSILDRPKIELGELKQLLCTNPLVSGLWVVEETDGARYYCPEKPTNEVNGTRFKYLEDSQSPPKSKFISKGKIRRQYIAPQSEAAAFFSRSLNDLNSSNWDKSFYEMAVQVRTHLSEDPSLDPVLGLDQLRRILQLGCEGSVAFKLGFEEIIEEIDASGVDLSVSWYLPDDAEAKRTRKIAKDVINALPDFKQCVAEVVSARNKFCFPPRQQLKWVGSLDRIGSEAWTCRPPLSINADGTLFVTAMSDSKSVTCTPVGELRNGKISWMPTATKHPTGSPLFFKEGFRAATDSEE